MSKKKMLNKTDSSIVLIQFVNLLFLVKYLERYTSVYLLISACFLCLSFLLWYKRELLNKIPFKIQTIDILVVIAFLTASVILFQLIPQNTLNVDRYSVITSFWDNFFKSEYVYFAKSHEGNYPGPMPFYFILALPFYAIGELGYYSLIGFLVFKFSLKSSKISGILSLTANLMLISSSFLIWEIVARSNILLNSSLVVFGILLMLKLLQTKSKYHILVCGITFGLLVSTRNVVIIPFIVFFMYLIKNKITKFKNLIWISIIGFMTFLATFLPFIYNHFDDFLIMNPFVIQSSFLMPTELSVFCIGLSFLSFFVVKKQTDIFFWSGIFLFFTIIVYMIYLIVIHGFTTAYFGNKADISYFILSVPFLLYYALSEKSIERKKQTK